MKSRPSFSLKDCMSWYNWLSSSTLKNIRCGQVVCGQGMVELAASSQISKSIWNGKADYLSPSSLLLPSFALCSLSFVRRWPCAAERTLQSKNCVASRPILFLFLFFKFVCINGKRQKEIISMTGIFKKRNFTKYTFSSVKTATYFFPSINCSANANWTMLNSYDIVIIASVISLVGQEQIRQSTYSTVLISFGGKI